MSLFRCLVLLTALSVQAYNLAPVEEDVIESVSHLLKDNNDEVNTMEKLYELKSILKKLVNFKEPVVSTPDEAEVSGEGEVIFERSCSFYMGCEECVSNKCAWCLASRSCKPDAAWQCDGQHDHVGLGGIGEFRQCPSLDFIDQKVAERKKRKEEAKLNPSLSDSRQNRTMTSEDGSDSGSIQLTKEEKTRELNRRALLAKENYGTTHPYETLEVEPTAANGEIRKAFRKMSLLYHPDKNSGADETIANAAFKDIVAAFDILGDPDKRSFFDEVGSGNSHESFNTLDDYLRFGQKNENNFYQGSKLITALTESVWEKRVGFGDSVWLIEFYAPWCGHCQQKAPVYKNIADMLEDEDGIEVGAVNCQTQPTICGNWFGIRSYPTLLAVNDFHGMRQEYSGDIDALAVTTWLKAVAAEWRWLMHASQQLVTIDDEKKFNELLLESTDFWVIVFLDGFDCTSCKTAKTNIMRLSASLRDFEGVQVGIVNCEDSDAFSLCKSQGMPRRPHSPVVKGYQTGDKKLILDKNKVLKGEVLYNANEVEPHVALEMLERTVRLTLANRLKPTDNNSTAAGNRGYEKETKEEEDKKNKDKPKPPPQQPQRPREPLWNGPKKRDPIAWNNNGGGGGPNRARIN